MASCQGQHLHLIFMQFDFPKRKRLHIILPCHCSTVLLSVLAKNKTLQIGQCIYSEHANRDCHYRSIEKNKTGANVLSWSDNRQKKKSKQRTSYFTTIMVHGIIKHCTGTVAWNGQLYYFTTKARKVYNKTNH